MAALRYCELCEKWFKRIPTVDCPLCGAETVSAKTDPNQPDPFARLVALGLAQEVR
jgi:predicted amidophosphoribosyltransferase